jgi:soluble lytic murein transglycosylase
MGSETRHLTCLPAFAALLALSTVLSIPTVSVSSAGANTRSSPQRANAGDGSIATPDADAEALGHVPFAIVAVGPPGDEDYLPRILAAYRTGDIAEAEILKSKLEQPAAMAVARWFAIRSGVAAGVDQITAFERDFGDWPVTALMRRRAEEALLTVRRSPARVRAFFAHRAPVTGAGRIAFALALRDDGADAQAQEMVRHAWRNDNFGPELEGRLLDEFPGVLGQADHRFRMERLLFKESWGAALRAASRAGEEYTTLVKARMGAFQGGKKAEKALGAVPAHLRSDSSYVFSRALYLRRKGKFADAAQVMAQAPRDPNLLADGDAWWTERRLIARALLDKRDPKAAYEVASWHGAETPAQRIEAEFHAGWIALRFRDDPAAAARHFAEAASIAATPISVARAAYWQGRAAEAAGAAEDAKRFYHRAADKPITFYGQLAGEKLRQPIELRAAESLDEEGRKAFEARVPIQALRLLQRIGETELAIGLYADLAQSLTDPTQLDALGEMALQSQNPRAALIVGKTAVQRGFPLDAHAYPINGIPSFDPIGDRVEPAMIHAIARQESAFNPKALSSAGARGLMQLMPATARRTAKRFGIGFDVDRLVDDPAYNAKIGSAHLGELMEDWRGSHILSFASYNAGGGNVMKWIKTYGDPRKPDVDPIDWIERIPFSETRNYVQRVLENLAVYRQRFHGPKPARTRTLQADALPAEGESRF